LPASRRIHNSMESPPANGQSLSPSTNGPPHADATSPSPPPRLLGNKYPNPPALARDPDLMGTIRKDVSTLGLVGEQDNSVLIYVVATSRLIREPLAVMLRGLTGAGKDTLIRIPCQLIPPECKIEAMEMTNAAWFRTEENFFVHKLFISGERKHSKKEDVKDAGRSLRQLLSNGKLDRGVPVPGAKPGEWETQWIKRPGPIAYMESTTDDSPFAEDLNRMLQVWVDSSDDQTRSVVEGIFSSRDPKRRPANDVIEAVIARHHAFQRWLQSVATQPVGIPYAEALGQLMPISSPAARRAASQLAAVIETITILHINHRESCDGWLLATLDDYRHARALLMPSMVAIFQVSEEHCKILVRVRDEFKDGTFTQTMFTKLMEYKHKMTASRLTGEFIKLGVWEEVTPHEGHTPATYRTVPGAAPERLMLPTVEAVEALRRKTQ
jgi:hypothetical protein